MGLGVNVRRLREQAGMEQAELADKVGVAIAKVLGTTAEKLLEE